MSTTIDAPAALPAGADGAVDVDRREIEGMRDRIAADHPGLDPERIEASLRAALARTQDAPIQTYRLVLAERDVRARLRAARRRPDPFALGS